MDTCQRRTAIIRDWRCTSGLRDKLVSGCHTQMDKLIKNAFQVIIWFKLSRLRRSWWCWVGSASGWASTPFRGVSHFSSRACWPSWRCSLVPTSRPSPTWKWVPLMLTHRSRINFYCLPGLRPVDGGLHGVRVRRPGGVRRGQSAGRAVSAASKANAKATLTASLNQHDGERPMSNSGRVWWTRNKRAITEGELPDTNDASSGAKQFVFSLSPCFNVWFAFPADKLTWYEELAR